MKCWENIISLSHSILQPPYQQSQSQSKCYYKKQVEKLYKAVMFPLASFIMENYLRKESVQKDKPPHCLSSKSSFSQILLLFLSLSLSYTHMESNTHGLFFTFPLKWQIEILIMERMF